jgi:hypothetical protein
MTLVCMLLLASCTGVGPTVHTTSAQNARVKSAASTASRPDQPSPQQAVVRCTWHRLAMNYYGGGAGMGTDFGLIRLRDIAKAPCRLAGRIGLAGLTPSGAVDTVTLIYHVPKALTLTARAARIETGREAPAAVTVASIQIEAEYRDQPHGGPIGLCTRRVIPARWRVTLATGSATVANVDRSDPYAGFRRLLTCAGGLNPPVPIVSR